MEGDLLSPDEPGETREAWFTVPVFLYRNAAGDYATVGRNILFELAPCVLGRHSRQGLARLRAAARDDLDRSVSSQHTEHRESALTQ
ncbi:MAG TPA: hypothetical protein VIX73_17105 [Kofleriaceae bacterium]